MDEDLIANRDINGEKRGNTKQNKIITTTAKKKGDRKTGNQKER